jgi:Zn-finger nucleic acid-binding protein
MKFSSPLICPHCAGKMTAIAYANIEVDRCRRCNAIWFDEYEAEKLQTHSGSERLDQACFTQTLTAKPTGSSLCPRCQVPLLKLLAIDQYSLWYQQCPHCCGILLEAGQFRQFKANFTPQGLLNRLKQWWRSKSP